MLLLIQYRRMATGKNGPVTRMPSGKMYSASMFIMRVCGFSSAASGCRATEAREFMCVAMEAMIIIGTTTIAIWTRVKSIGSPGFTKACHSVTGCVMNDDSGTPKSRASRKFCTWSTLKK